MSKGLEALQNLRTFYIVVSKDLIEHYIFASDTKEYQIIENELKGKDNLVSMCDELAEIVGLKDKDYLELKEIITKKIKEHEMLKNLVVKMFGENGLDFESWKHFDKSQTYHIVYTNSYEHLDIPISKEEYDFIGDLYGKRT